MRVVLLLSDGRANSGHHRELERLSRLALDAFQGGVQTSTFGLGADYDGALMSSIASDGAGGYYYLRESGSDRPGPRDGARQAARSGGDRGRAARAAEAGREAAPASTGRAG